MKIPADMIREDLAVQCNARAVVSMRDMLVSLGASDEELRDYDEQDEILAREPWRRDGIRFIPVCDKDGNEMRYGGCRIGTMQGEVDWSGTRFAK